MLETSSASVAHQLLLDRSTNLDELAKDPVRVLPASAFLVTSGSEWLAWVVLFTVLAAPVEHRIRSGHTITVFALGHVGATLLTAAGLRLALEVDLAESSVVHAVDVGPSYGFIALAGLMTYLLSPRLRWIYLGAWSLGLVAAAVIFASFTDFGHLVALLIGLGCRPLVPRPFGGRSVSALSFVGTIAMIRPRAAGLAVRLAGDDSRSVDDHERAPEHENEQCHECTGPSHDELSDVRQPPDSARAGERPHRRNGEDRGEEDEVEDEEKHGPDGQLLPGRRKGCHDRKVGQRSSPPLESVRFGTAWGHEGQPRRRRTLPDGSCEAA